MEKKKPSRQTALVNKIENLYRGKQFSFVKEDITLPNKRRTEMAFVRHPGSTAVVPLFEDGTVAMTLQYRHAVSEYLLEIPAGTMEPGESALDCTKRELEEETGLVAEKFIKLGQVFILPAYSDEKIYLYLARDFTVTRQNLDQDEIIEVVKYPLKEALQMIQEGRITCALSILCLQQTWIHLQASV